MRTFAIISLVAGATVAAANDPERENRYAERAPLPKRPGDHTPERAGTVDVVSARAKPTLTSHYTTGYVGGGGLARSNPRSTGCVTDGTFGWDYTLFSRRPGRIFLGFLGNKPHQPTFQPKYNTDGPEVEDVVAKQPFKKAVKEAIAEKKGGGHE